MTVSTLLSSFNEYIRKTRNRSRQIILLCLRNNLTIFPPFNFVPIRSGYIVGLKPFSLIKKLNVYFD